jgi:hypothetical protein
LPFSLKDDSGYTLGQILNDHLREKYLVCKSKRPLEEQEMVKAVYRGENSETRLESSGEKSGQINTQSR